MHALLPVLEQVHYEGPFPAGILNKQAANLPTFSRAWLIHAISSDVSSAELCCALYWAKQNKLSEYQQLVSIWQQLLPHVSASTQAREALDGLLQAHQFLAPCSDSFLTLWYVLQHIPKLTVLEHTEEVQHYHTDFTPNLAAQVVKQASEMLLPAEVYTPTQVQAVDKVRNNQQCLTGSPCQDVLFASIERYIAYSLGKLLINSEPLILYRYGPGHEYKWHCDFIPDQHPQSQTELKLFGQRTATAIFYFSEDFIGGDTAFKVWQCEERGKIGSLIYFNNLLPDGRPNPDSVHCGKPVLTGEKWIGTMWFRQKPLWTRNALMQTN